MWGKTYWSFFVLKILRNNPRNLQTEPIRNQLFWCNATPDVFKDSDWLHIASDTLRALALIWETRGRQNTDGWIWSDGGQASGLWWLSARLVCAALNRKKMNSTKEKKREYACMRLRSNARLMKIIGRNAWKRIIFVKMFQWTMTSSYCCSQDFHKMLRLEKTNTSAALQLT